MRLYNYIVIYGLSVVKPPAPQNRSLGRSWFVNGSMTATATDMDVLHQLFSAHYARVARVIGRVIRDQARAEELAVEVFLRWRSHPSGDGSHAEGWLYRTAVREALDELRRQTRRQRFERALAWLRSPPPGTPEQSYVAMIEQQNVRAVLGALKREHAAILLLWVEELSYAEMAAALEMRPSSVGSLLSRAQEAFRKEYVKRYEQAN
jgi:RNA polymerase sigma-70 factor, ECF subfamily